MNARSFGTLCIVGSVIGVADGVRRMLLGQPLTDGLLTLDTITCLVMIIAAIGGLCGLLGFIALHATGTNPIFRLLTFLPAISYIAAIIGGLGLVTGLFTSNADNPLVVMLWSLSDIFNPVSWLVVAIVTIAAKSWHGWRRFVPLAIVVAFPLGIVASVSTGLVGTFVIIAYTALALLGYAVQSSVPAPQLREATA